MGRVKVLQRYEVCLPVVWEEDITDVAFQVVMFVKMSGWKMKVLDLVERVMGRGVVEDKLLDREVVAKMIKELLDGKWEEIAIECKKLLEGVREKV